LEKQIKGMKQSIPSGKPADPAYASAMEKQGEAMNAARDQQAQAMAAAKAKAGAH